jgi:hypothetical protein
MIMKTQKGKELLDRAAQRMALTNDSIGKAVSIVSYTKVDPRLFRIVAVCQGEIPSFEDLRKWSIANSDGKFKLVEDTLNHYDVMPYPLVSFIVEANVVRRPFAMAMEDKNLVAVADNMYMDIDLKTPWKEEEVGGNKFLVRVEEDSLADFLSTQMSIPGPRTNKAINAVLAMTAYKGDKVKYVRPDGVPSRGQVTKVGSDGTLYVRDAETQSTYERFPGTILEILKEGPASKVRDNKLESFFAEIYGPKMAKELMS